MQLLIQKYIKKAVRIKAPNSVNASKRKHKNQINHYNKQRRVLMAKTATLSVAIEWTELLHPSVQASEVSFRRWTLQHTEDIRQNIASNGRLSMRLKKKWRIFMTPKSQPLKERGMKNWMNIMKVQNSIHCWWFSVCFNSSYISK